MNYFTKRRIPVLVITILLTFSLFFGCAKKESEPNTVFFNQQYADSGMLTINKKAFSNENSTVLDNGGFGLHLPQTMQDLKNSGNFNVLCADYTAHMFYLSEKGKEIISTGGSQEEMPDLMKKNMFQCFAIARIQSNDENAQMELEHVKQMYSKLETIAVVGDNTYYFAYNDDCSALALSDTDKANIDKILSDREMLKREICLFPIQEKTISTKTNMNNFSTKTLDGDSYTQDNLSNYDITMVNIWTTWCGPCVEELPELQKLYDMLPGNANMITICADAQEESELAKQDYKGCEK